MHISLSFGKEANEKIYTFVEEPNSRLDDKLIFEKQTLIDNIVGVAIYSVPDLIMVKVNQKYLDFHDFPYNQMETSIGLSIREIVTGYTGTESDAITRTVLKTQKSSYRKEIKFERFERGITYWDTTRTPIFESGKIKYMLLTTSDVTERVLKNQRIERQNKVIEQQKEQLEQKNTQLNGILENLSEGVILSDHEGKYIMRNKEARNLIYQSEELIDLGDSFNTTKYFDMEGNRISFENLPGIRALKGEIVKNVKMHVINPEKEYFINNSAIPIHNTKGELTTVVSCFHDITDIIQQSNKIEHQNKELLIAEKEKNEILKREIEMKDEFLSLISHEFRTPLTVINSAIQAMELICKNELSDKAKGFLNKIRQNSNRQLKLVNNLLDITRMNAGHFKINKTNIDIVLFTRSIAESITIFAEQKRIKLSFSSTLKKKIMGVDDEKYERILLNLLSNAIKFTPEGQSVTVKLFQKIVNGKRMVCIQVKDNGIGIPDEKKELIFERFGQVDTYRTRQAEGTGIGLHLVKMFVEVMGGEIGLESEVGKGSVFTILLPIEKVKEISIEKMPVEITNQRLIQAKAIEFSDIYF